MKRRLGRVTRNWLGLIGVFICVAFGVNVWEISVMASVPWWILAFICARQVKQDY